MRDVAADSYRQPHFNSTNQGVISVMADVRGKFRAQGLVRPREGRVLAGVVAGLGRRFGIDPWPARLLFVLILLVIPGSQLLVYPLLWILMPSEAAPVHPTPPPTSSSAPPK